MSRAGGSGRGGRGGYAGPPGARLNHGTVPFEISPELLLHEEEMHKDSGLYPKMDVPHSKPLSREELVTVEAYRELRAKRQLGPYYFPSPSGEAFNGRSTKRQRLSAQNSGRAMFNAFEDQKSYAALQEAVRRRFKEAQYSKLPFPKDVLPKELWGVCGLAKGDQYWPNLQGDRKSLLSMQQRLARIHDDTEDADDPADDDDLDEKDPDDANSNADDEDKDRDSDAASERDDDFEDAEDDMAADYNAEQYFDDGEDENDDLGARGARGDEGGAYE